MPNGDHPTPIENVVFFTIYMIIGFIVFSLIGKLSISIGVRTLVDMMMVLFRVLESDIFKSSYKLIFNKNFFLKMKLSKIKVCQ